MRLPWRRDPKDKAETERVEAQLRQVQEQWPKVRLEAGRAAQHYRRNHIADAVYAVFEGKR